MRIALGLLASLALFACSSSPEASSEEDGAPNGGGSQTATDDVKESAPQGSTTPIPPPAGCTPLGTTDAELATATEDGEAILSVEAQALNKTSWADSGNEAVVLEVRKDDKRVGHLVLHQGADPFTYTMHAGALKKGDRLTVRVSELTAKNAQKSACITSPKLAAAPAEMAEGLANAPILKWPAQKAFNDLPVLSGWSRKGKGYQVVYSNEDGGTVELCGGGSRGMRSEIARWGRGVDIEGAYSYGGGPAFERCGGAKVAPRMEGKHPILYYGNGHNNLFESRGGYGQTCGSSDDNKSNGDLEGWNKGNPGNEEAKDDPFTIVLRPAPVDLDAIGYDKLGGRREGLVDTYAPWLYRVLDSELKREKRVDDDQVLSMERYLYVDVYANDVGGLGDATCGPISAVPGLHVVEGGFVLRAEAKDGTVSNGPQMTKSFFGGDGNGVKRIAIPLARGVKASDIVKVTFDAYDRDGIYFLGIGDAFVPRAEGSNGATLDYVNKDAIKRADVYVDDDKSSCSNGANTKDGKAYPCAGTSFTLAF